MRKIKKYFSFLNTLSILLLLVSSNLIAKNNYKMGHKLITYKVCNIKKSAPSVQSCTSNTVGSGSCMDSRKTIDIILKNYADSTSKDSTIIPCFAQKKKTLISLYLTPYFKGVDINHIDRIKIKKFKDSWADKIPTRNQSLGELKRILNYALEYDYIKVVPKFDRIPKSRERQKVASIATIREVLPYVFDEYYSRMFHLLEIYPIRPCELRCLRWKDIDIKKRKLTVQRHLSDGIELDGRKSIAADNENGKGKITYPITDSALLVISGLTRSINKNDLLFSSKRGIQKFISHTVLPNHWRAACKLAKVPYFEPYEIKHARAFEISENNNGNIKETMDALGHTNINTTMRYIKGETNLSNIFN